MTERKGERWGRDYLELPQDYIEAALDASRAEQVIASLGVMSAEHIRRRALLEKIHESENKSNISQFDKEHIREHLEREIQNPRSIKRERAAWRDFVLSKPTSLQAAAALAHVSHFPSSAHELLPVAFRYFLAKIKQEKDPKRFKRAIETASNYIKSRHIEDEKEKFEYVDILDGILKKGIQSN